MIQSVRSLQFSRKKLIRFTVFILAFRCSFICSAQIFPNSDFELGSGAGCACATSYTCNNDAGRVVDGVHPVFVAGNQGCITGPTNYCNSLGAHSGTGYIFFYAGADNITTGSFLFAGGEQVQLCVWYCGPQGSGAPGQNGPLSHFKFGVDGVAVSPNQLVPVNTPWTQYCFTWTATPGNHSFNVLSGGAAQYSIWFDDFVVTDSSQACTPPNPNITGNTTFCSGGSSTLDAGTCAGCTYLWNTGATTQTINVTTAGNYWVDVTDACGTGTDSVTITVNANPVINLGNDTILCTGQSLLLNATTAGATYLWQNNSTNSTFNVVSAGNYSVQVTVNGCTGNDNINVSYTPPIAVDIGNDTSVCPGTNLLLDATTAGATYLWQDNSTNATLTTSGAGTYWVEVTVNNCNDTDTIVISTASSIPVNLGNDTTVCTGNTVTLDATTSGATYLWQDNSTNATFNVTAAGTYFVEVNVSGCTGSDTVSVNYISNIPVDIGNDTSLCTGQSLLLDATTPGATYLWQDNSANATFNVTQSGTYFVNVNASGCTGSDTVDITFNASVQVNLGNDTLLCSGNSVLLDATTAGATYLWNTGSTNATLNVSQGGTYTVTVSLGGCTGGDTINVVFNTVIADFSFSPSAPTINNPTVQFTNLSQGAFSYVWDFAGMGSSFSIDPAFTFPADTAASYIICLTSQNHTGCIDSICKIITIEEDFALYVPNAFTPNGKGENELFLPVMPLHDFSEYRFMIFNRWGEMIFDTNDSYKGWDGTYKGISCQEDVYVWKIKLMLSDEVDVKEFYGHVTLLR